MSIIYSNFPFLDEDKEHYQTEKKEYNVYVKYDANKQEAVCSFNEDIIYKASNLLPDGQIIKASERTPYSFKDFLKGEEFKVDTWFTSDIIYVIDPKILSNYKEWSDKDFIQFFGQFHACVWFVKYNKIISVDIL